MFKWLFGGWGMTPTTGTPPPTEVLTLSISQDGVFSVKASWGGGCTQRQEQISRMAHLLWVAGSGASLGPISEAVIEEATRVGDLALGQAMLAQANQRLSQERLNQPPSGQGSSGGGPMISPLQAFEVPQR